MKAPIDGALNPNHGVTRELSDQWYKLCAIVMYKHGITRVEITTADIESFAASGRANIVGNSKKETLILQLVTDAEAVALAKKAGGLPV